MASSKCGLLTRRSLLHEEEYENSASFRRLRTSNLPATNEEISHIRDAVVPTISDDISFIDTKIASLYEAIKSMEEERTRLINIQNKYNSLISLRRALPPEIWSQIFLCTLHSYADSINAFDASGTIWQLSHVCQEWRDVALSLRSFWSNMVIRFPQAAQHEAGVERLVAILQRSRQSPLDVYLSQEVSKFREIEPINPLILKCMLDLLFSQSYRWRKACLSFSRGDWTLRYAPLRNRLPCLESLALYFAQAEDSAVSVFEDCPRLKKVTLSGDSPLLAKLPWTQITELCLGDISFERQCMRLIGQCPSLETLTMPFNSAEFEDDDDESPYTPITCLNMRKLTVISVPVIDALTVPRLREVFLNPPLGTRREDDVLNSLKQLFIRSNCMSSLTSLSLINAPLAASAECSLLSILSQTNSLAHLKLCIRLSMDEFDEEWNVSDEEEIAAIVKSLEVVPSQYVTFLPLLSSLDIRVSNHLDSQSLLYFGPIGSFASTLESRWRGDDNLGLARLTKCSVFVQARYLDTEEAILRDNVVISKAASAFDDEERQMFEYLIDQGMDLSIRVTSNYIDPHAEYEVNRYPVFAVPPMMT